MYNPFFDDVYEVVKLIPKGKVTTYGAIARYLGTPRKARIVGWALNGVSAELKIPAHRVVNSKGELSGAVYFGENNEMSTKLMDEGVKIKQNKLTNFATDFWDPSEELL